MMTPTDVTLDDLRRDIDAIDRHIHDLLMRRGALARKVAQVKGADGPYYRPAREAQVIRRLVARHAGDYPASTVVRVWREIISATVAIEGRISIAAYIPPDRPQFWDITRDHFGAIPVQAHQQPGSVMRAASESATIVGVLPFPRQDDPDPWWRYLVTGDRKAPRIVGRLPFTGADSTNSALLIARVPVESSGDDQTFLVIETLAEMSRARFLSRLASAGFEVGFIASWQEPGRQTERLHLVEVNGYFGPKDAKLKAIDATEPEAFGRIVWLGSYPVPIGAPIPPPPPAS
jgi:chorismate mutase-like protein